jgi:hypothetical protein
MSNIRNGSFLFFLCTDRDTWSFQGVGGCLYLHSLNVWASGHIVATGSLACHEGETDVP